MKYKFFDSLAELKQALNENKDVVLVTKKAGEHFWHNRGKIWEPLSEAEEYREHDNYWVYGSIEEYKEHRNDVLKDFLEEGIDVDEFNRETEERLKAVEDWNESKAIVEYTPNGELELVDKECTGYEYDSKYYRAALIIEEED